MNYGEMIAPIFNFNIPNALIIFWSQILHQIMQLLYLTVVYIFLE